MSADDQTLGGFETRLLAELRTVVSERAAHAATSTPTRAPRIGRRPLALAGGVVAAAAAVGVTVATVGGGTEPAYAVEPHSDGTVTVEIRALSDAGGLQSKLREAGVPADVTYLPWGKTCREPRFAAADQGPTSIGGPLTGGKASSVSSTKAMGGQASDPPSASVTFTIDPSTLRAGQTLVITTSESADPTSGRHMTQVGMATAVGAVAPCELVDAPAPSTAPAPAGAGHQSGTGAAGGTTSAGG
jgi:hypothetical protein